MRREREGQLSGPVPLSLCLLREFVVHSQLSFPGGDQERVRTARDQEALEEGGEEGAGCLLFLSGQAAG